MAGALSAGQAIYLYAILRARSWRGRRIRRHGPDGPLRVRFRDLEAVVRAVPFEQASGGEQEIREHHRIVETAMRRGPVLPLPYGVIFRGRRQLIKLLQEQYLVIDDALSLVDGCWEMRLHVAPISPGEAALELSDLAMHCYTELRRHARAAVHLPGAGDVRRLLTAAFLVERNSWIDFVERTEDLDSAHPELSFDVTGPWPPYDFVRVNL